MDTRSTSGGVESTEVRDANGMTPLMLAVDAGRHDRAAAELLLRAGAAVSLKAKNGLTSLQYATENGADAVAALLRLSGRGRGGTR